MKICVIVPAFNEEKLISTVLRSIKAACGAFSERGWLWEVIVCDNNSSDRTAELARAEGAQVVFEPVNQIARARNTGARSATGDWLLFIDADSWPSRALFADAAAAIAGGEYLACGAALRFDDVDWLSGTLAEGWNWLSRQLRWLAGSFVLCEATAFREVGGFNEALYASEEIDLSRRLKRLGRRRGKGIQILDAHPLVTSGRKIHLYSKGEYARFLWRTIRCGGRTLNKRSECVPWYDGRR